MEPPVRQSPVQRWARRTARVVRNFDSRFSNRRVNDAAWISVRRGIRKSKFENRKSSEVLLRVEQALVELHAEGETEGFELLLDLVQRFFAEVAVLEHLLLGLHRQLTNGRDVGVVEAVGGADRELDLVDRHVEELAELVLLLADFGLLALEFVRLVGDAIEDIEVVLEDRGRLLQRIVRRDAS